MILRDGTKTEDPRLDRLVEFDPRSRAFSVTDGVPDQYLKWDGLEVIQKVRIKQKGPHLNQGREGACVGMALTNAMRYEPNMGSLATYNEKFAVTKIYHPAQRNDQWPGGEYPGADPRMQGTSVLAGLKELKRLGLIKAYRWAFTMEEVMLGIGYFGVAIFGLPWYEGMAHPKADGRITPTGRILGGHCIAGFRYSRDQGKVWMAQTWGMDHGVDGEVYMMIDDLDKVRQQQGECAFVEKV